MSLWDGIPDNLRMLIVIVGMAFLSLLVAGLISRYERYLAEKRLIVQRLLRGVYQLEAVLNAVPKGAIPKGVGPWMRQEILARYIAIKKVMPNHNGINQSINQAGQLLELEPAGLAEATPPPLLERTALDEYWRGLEGVLELIQSRDVGSGISRQKRDEYLSLVLLLKAESASAYFSQRSSQLANAENYKGALAEIRALDGYFQHINIMSGRLLELKGQNKERFIECHKNLLSESLD